MVEFSYNSDDKVITVLFSGRMDSIEAARLVDIFQEEPVIKNIQPDDKLVFDLKDVDYIASSFIRICVSHAKMAGAGRFSIAHCQPFVKKTFKISGLDDLLNIT